MQPQFSLNKALLCRVHLSTDDKYWVIALKHHSTYLNILTWKHGTNQIIMKPMSTYILLPFITFYHHTLYASITLWYIYVYIIEEKHEKHMIHNKNQNNFPSQLPNVLNFLADFHGIFVTHSWKTSFLPCQGPNCDSQGFSRVQHHLPHRWVFGRCSDMGRTPTQQGDLHMELRHLDGWRIG